MDHAEVLERIEGAVAAPGGLGRLVETITGRGRGPGDIAG